MATSSSREDPAFADFRRAFDRVFQPAKPSRRFGGPSNRHQGFSDDHDGVQWNAGVDRERGVVTVGVNLEGMEYQGWPIARFIESERAAPRLPAFARSYEHAGAAEVWFSRDAWQFASRFDILEQHFGPEPPLALSRLSEDLWRMMLNEAYDCLDSHKGHRGRARQMVTLSTGQREMTVSPHLKVKMVVRDSVDLNGLDADFRAAREKLESVGQLVRRQCGA
jgi:hypothetical protein